MIAVIWEVYNDRHGDLNKGSDVLIRVLLFAIEAGLLVLLFHKDVWICFVLSSATHFAFFDYAIAYTLIKNGTLEPPRGITYHWFTYTAKAGVVDNLKFWREMNPYLKLAVRLIYLTLSLIIFLQR